MKGGAELRARAVHFSRSTFGRFTRRRRTPFFGANIGPPCKCVVGNFRRRYARPGHYYVRAAVPAGLAEGMAVRGR